MRHAELLAGLAADPAMGLVVGLAHLSDFQISAIGLQLKGSAVVRRGGLNVSMQLVRLPCAPPATLLLPRMSPLVRRMDRFYLPTGASPMIVNAFFDMISDIYDDLTTRETNLSVAAALLGALLVDCNAGTRILDFGCGSGLSLLALDRVRAPPNCTIMGVDTSAGMRTRARARGLRVLSPAAWRRTKADFDVAVATFVMHFRLPDDDLLHLARALCPGAPLAVNYFKAEEADRKRLVAVLSAGGMVLERTFEIGDEKIPEPSLRVSEGCGVSIDILQSYQPAILVDGELSPPFRAALIPPQDLFNTPTEAIVAFATGTVEPSACRTSGPGSKLAAFEVASGVVVTVDPGLAASAAVQAFLFGLSTKLRSDSGAHGPTPTPGRTSLDPAAGLTLWSPSGGDIAERAGTLWRTIDTAGVLSPIEALTVPRLYGNKLRLSRFIGGVVEACAEPDTPVLDLMAGTGALARALSSRRPICTNDGNPYAALFSRSQGLTLSDSPTDLFQRLQPAYRDNYSALSERVAIALDQEAGFLHGDSDPESQRAYMAFADEQVLAPSDGAAGPYRLATERYANVYFGLAQAIEIDSLRAAIDACAPQRGSLRDLLLTTLLLAATTCASGPHFAQPNQPNAPRTMRTLIERRARSVAWEFDLALTRIAARPPPGHPFETGTQMDWREALSAFARRHAGAAATVYVDPPYSKLQYSRYYHVLNVLLSYDYPEIVGRGRYPPRAYRFSSRFEYQPGTARNEFEQLFAAIADNGFTLMISYSNRGFVAVPDLARLLSQYFPKVTAFSQAIRHHSQGRVLTHARGEVMEYILVGHRSDAT